MTARKVTIAKPTPTDHLLHQIKVAGLPEPKREYRFDRSRRWRIDLAWPERRLAVEVEGGTWQKSRHTNPIGYLRDCEKYNALAVGGWTLLRFTSMMIEGGTYTEKLTRKAGAIRRQVCVGPCAVEIIASVLTSTPEVTI